MFLFGMEMVLVLAVQQLTVNIVIGMNLMSLIMQARNITLMLHLLMLEKSERGMTYPIPPLVVVTTNLKGI